MVVGAARDRPAERDRAGDDAGAERAHAERFARARRSPRPRGVGGEEDGGQVGAAGDGEHADARSRSGSASSTTGRRRRVADRHAVGGDTADDRAERERRQDRGEREDRVDRARLARARARRPAARRRRRGRGSRTPAMNSGTASVEAIEPNASGYAVQNTVSTKISQTWLASHTGAIESWACSRTRSARSPRPAEQLPEPGAEVGAAEHRVERQTGQHEHQRERLQEHVRRAGGRGRALGPPSSSGPAASRRSTQASAARDAPRRLAASTRSRPGSRRAPVTAAEVGITR